MKTYAPYRFVEKYEHKNDDGTVDSFYFKAGVDTFLIYKSLTGECLTDAIKRHNANAISATQVPNFSLLQKFITKEEAEREQMLIEHRAELAEALTATNAMASKPFVYDNGWEFSDALIFAMFVAGLPEIQRTEAMGEGLHCLPSEVYQDMPFFMKLSTNIMRTEKDLKKKGLLRNKQPSTQM